MSQLKSRMEHTRRLGDAGNHVVVVEEVDCQVALEARSAVMAAQAPLVLRGRRGGARLLAGAAGGPGRGRGRGHGVGINAQRGGDAVGDAQQLAMWLCNGDFGGRSWVGRVRTQRGGRALLGGGARGQAWLGRRRVQARYGLFIIVEFEQRAAARGAARRDGRVGVIKRAGRQSQPRRPLRRSSQRRPDGVGHGGVQKGARGRGSFFTSAVPGLPLRVALGCLGLLGQGQTRSRAVRGGRACSTCSGCFGRRAATERFSSLQHLARMHQLKSD